ncbi:beta-lactamase-like protein [Obelidium mucronatum]|nr:beta-lactamase-like protein [Obelidium mucronatum]
MVSVVPVPVNADNYAYLLLTDKAKGLCAAVDPGRARQGYPGCKGEGMDGRHDSNCGNVDLVNILAPKTIPVYGGDDRIPALSFKVSDKKAFTLGDLTITPYFTVCHTRGSVSYFVTTPDSPEKAVFTGDTLFIAGCGRFFEGTPEEMHTSLNTILAALPEETQVFCGHEYTASNLRFAVTVDPDNLEVKEKLEWSKDGKVTVPSTIGEEKRINPFMRVGVASVQDAIGGERDPVAVMAKLLIRFPSVTVILANSSTTLSISLLAIAPLANGASNATVSPPFKDVFHSYAVGFAKMSFSSATLTLARYPSLPWKQNFTFWFLP